MNLQYKGFNSSGRKVWTELDLVDSFHPEGQVMEERHAAQYKQFVNEIEEKIGRSLAKNELSTIHWLSGYEGSTIKNMMDIINAAFNHGKESK